MLVAAIATVMALTSPLGRDYDNPPPGCALTAKTCDDPAPALNALSHGHVSAFFHAQPFLGPVTLVLRAPVVAAVRASGGGVKAQYRWGALLCLLVLAAFGLCLALIAAQRGLAFWVQALIAVGAVLNPVTFAALKWGHPEELVAASFAAAALLCALRRRPTAAGILLGLAIATKAWALLAIPALLVALPAAWRRMLVAVVLTAGIVVAPMAIGAPHHFRDNVTEVGKLGSQFGTETPANLLWPVATVEPLGGGHAARVSLAVARGARLFVFAAALLLALAWRRKDGRAPESVLLLLALTLMVRNLFDPSNHSYYQAGPLLALLAYETLTRRAFPFATAAFVILFAATDRITSHGQGLDTINALYLGWAVPFVMYMAWELLSRAPWSSSEGPSRGGTSPRLAGATTPTR